MTKIKHDKHNHDEESARAARAAHARMMRTDYSGGTMYVYFAPYRIEAFHEDDPIPAGWALAWPERVPGALDAAGLVAWFAARSARVPYLIDKKGL